MKTNKLFSSLLLLGTRLTILAAMLFGMVSNVTVAAAAPVLTLTALTVGAQQGALTTGTGGSVTYLVTVTKNNSNNNTSAALSISWTGGTPTGVTTSFSPASVSWGGSGGNRTSTLTITTTAATPAAARAFTVRAQRSGGDFQTAAGTLAVTAPQTITFGALANKTFGDADFNVSATASSGLAVSFAAGGNCTVAGTLVHLTGAGSCTITASQAGNAVYLAAPTVQQSFSIAKANQTITFNPLANKLDIDSSFTVNATVTSGLTVAFTAAGECSVAGNLVSLTGALGSCTITASQTGSTNYNAAVNVSQSFNISAFSGTHLYAVGGSTTLPNGAAVNVWGYSETNSPVTQPGGPTLYANQGDTVSIALHNELGENTALLFVGQSMIPDLTGAAPGGVKVYTFTASQPGTFLYEAGLLDNAQHQVAMGLYGALVVRPATAGQAYNSVATAFDDEAVLVLSEIDPALNNSASPAAFDMRNYHPSYWLINGKSYPQTAPISTVAGHNVLLRYVNAGLQVHSMSTLGVRQSMIAIDGNMLNFAHSMVAESIGPGRTMDTIAAVPVSAGDGSKFAVYEASFIQHNNNAAGFGGMLTFLTVSGTPSTGDTTGPVTSAVSLTPTSVSATVSDAASGGSNVSAAEFFIDSTGANGSGTAMTGAFGSATVNVSGVISPALSGTHTVYVHGQDSAGNWGPFISATNNNDTAGPAITGLALSPAASNGTANVALSGTANDTASGGSNIAAAEYTIDGGTAVTMTVSPPAGAKIASLSATISAATVNGLSVGSHIVAVRGQDSLGNWGSSATINLVVDKTGPVTSAVAASPNPSNAKIGFNSSVPAVRITASMTDTASNISAAEGFIDTVGANGAGFSLVPTDGQFNNTTESGYVDIPLTTINLLSDGNHTIYVHSKDAAGNWGATSSVILVVDKTAPTISSVALAPNTIGVGAASVTLNVTANGTGTALTGGQYWIDGTATPPANPTAFAGTSVVIATSALAGGTHTVYVQMQDAAKNWSTVSSGTLYVVLAVNDSRTITANTSSTPQTSDANVANGVLANDLPSGVGSAAILSAPVRTSGSGSGTIAVSCPASLGTPASPAVGGNTICTNGAYRVTLTPITSNSGTQRRNSKLGTYQFTYTLTVNGVTSTATVTITAN